MTEAKLLTLAADATKRAVRSPGLLGVLCLLHFASAGAVWLWADHVLGPQLQGRPGPDLFTWAALAQGHRALLPRLIGGDTVLLVLQFVLGALAAALTLGRFSRISTGHACKGPFLWLLAMRLLVLIAAAAMICGLWFTLAPASMTFRQADNELLIIGLHLITAVPFLLPVLLMLCVLHYAQALLVQGKIGLFAALAGGLRLVHSRPGAAFGLWLIGWTGWLVVGAVLFLPGLDEPFLAEAAALIRVGIHLWMLAASWELVTAEAEVATT